MMKRHISRRDAGFLCSHALACSSTVKNLLATKKEKQIEDNDPWENPPEASEELKNLFYNLKSAFNSDIAWNGRFYL